MAHCPCASAFICVAEKINQITQEEKRKWQVIVSQGIMKQFKNQRIPLKTEGFQLFTLPPTHQIGSAPYRFTVLVLTVLVP